MAEAEVRFKVPRELKEEMGFPTLSSLTPRENSSQETDFDIMKRDLNAYRRYCDQAATLLDTTEGKAPGATKLIMRGCR